MLVYRNTYCWGEKLKLHKAHLELKPLFIKRLLFFKLELKTKNKNYKTLFINYYDYLLDMSLVNYKIVNCFLTIYDRAYLFGLPQIVGIPSILYVFPTIWFSGKKL